MVLSLSYGLYLIDNHFENVGFHIHLNTRYTEDKKGDEICKQIENVYLIKENVRRKIRFEFNVFG